ncbi:iron-sulfur cluster carrier protein ApbC [Zooshikella sp. RANM57]|uniref:iron-sulfur cluster carrier protein ApbC n=1 Tax=Zooshikella sp. RANM57 TaxID=3425863 RepID=UPI003D6DB921
MTQRIHQHVELLVAQSLQSHLDIPLTAHEVIKHININGGHVDITIDLNFPANDIKQAFEETLQQGLLSLPDVSTVNIEVNWAIPNFPRLTQIPALQQVKNIIAVASGKGGVGKSTTTANLALALSQEGARVGVLDADIYGPSQGMMLGVAEDVRPETIEDKYFKPLIAHDIQVMSMAFLVTDKTPMVWRGPMVSGALQQLLQQTLWQSLDYLIIDMPPGTGDIQLTLAQKVPVTAAVMVTTPQDIALLDVCKGIEMFHKVKVPVAGIVENMAMHVCSQCGHIEPIFGEGGGAQLADEYHVPLLGSLPLDLKIRQQTDSGTPTVLAEPESQIAERYRVMARNMAVQLGKITASMSSGPTISIADD